MFYLVKILQLLFNTGKRMYFEEHFIPRSDHESFSQKLPVQFSVRDAFLPLTYIDHHHKTVGEEFFPQMRNVPFPAQFSRQRSVFFFKLYHFLHIYCPGTAFSQRFAGLPIYQLKWIKNTFPQALGQSKAGSGWGVIYFLSLWVGVRVSYCFSLITCTLEFYFKYYCFSVLSCPELQKLGGLEFEI